MTQWSSLAEGWNPHSPRTGRWSHRDGRAGRPGRVRRFAGPAAGAPHRRRAAALRRQAAHRRRDVEAARAAGPGHRRADPDRRGRPADHRPGGDRRAGRAAPGCARAAAQPAEGELRRSRRCASRRRSGGSRSSNTATASGSSRRWRPRTPSTKPPDPNAPGSSFAIADAELGDLTALLDFPGVWGLDLLHAHGHVSLLQTSVDPHHPFFGFDGTSVVAEGGGALRVLRQHLAARSHRHQPHRDDARTARRHRAGPGRRGHRAQPPVRARRLHRHLRRHQRARDRSAHRVRPRGRRADRRGGGQGAERPQDRRRGRAHHRRPDAAVREDPGGRAHRGAGRALRRLPRQGRRADAGVRRRRWDAST